MNPTHPVNPSHRAPVPKTDFAELSVAVRQMEARLQNDPDRLVRYLVDAYHELLPQLGAEHADRRDELLARSAALKLVRAVARQGRRAA
jgi:hypothetical protein